MKVVFIAGCGRSGSTLLDLVLGTSPNAFSAGQLENLLFFLKEHDERRPDKKSFKDDQGCSSQNSVVWGPIKRELEMAEARIYDPRCPLSVRGLIWSLILRKPFSMEHFDDDLLYGSILWQARMVKNQHVAIIIDSSKNIKRLISMRQSSQLDIYVIHLIRDVHGYVYSNLKRGKSWLAALRRWVILNSAYVLYLSRAFSPEKVKRISYDRFTGETAKVLREINDWAGLKVDESGYLQVLAKEKSYRFSGSNMRFKPISSISRDLSWKRGLNTWQKFIIITFAGILNGKWAQSNARTKE
jgi:hypothetical protein